MNRVPLGAITGNIPRRKELTPSQRSKIEGAADFGGTPTEIAKRYNFSRPSIYDTLNNIDSREDHKSTSRSGRPLSVSEHLERLITRFIRKEPVATYAEVKFECGTTISRQTLRKVLKKSGIGNWLAKKRPRLEEVHAKLRLKWALDHKDWTGEDWYPIIWSDESSVERGQGGKRLWVFRTPQQKWNKEMIQTYGKGHDISIMVWAAIWVGGKSNLVIMVRDEDSPKGGYSSVSYIKVLEEQIPRCWQPGRVFIQDNAPIHKSEVVKNWFLERGIPLKDWPPYSPDLNPIEHVWAWLKEWIIENKPHLKDLGKGQVGYDALAAAIVEGWEAIPQPKIDALILSMDNRINAVLEAKGWHTKY